MEELMLLNCGAGEDLRVPWTARRLNQSILKKISPVYSFEGLMLKLQFFGHLMQRANSLGNTLMLGKIERSRTRLSAVVEDEMVGWHHWLNEHVFEQTPRRWWRTGKPGMLQSMGSKRPGHDLVTEQQARLGDLVQLRFWHHFGSQNWGHSISIWQKEIIARLFCLLWYFLALSHGVSHLWFLWGSCVYVISRSVLCKPYLVFWSCGLSLSISCLGFR